MVSVAPLSTFEIELTVSLTRWISRLKPIDREVLNFTILLRVVVWVKQRNHWIGMRTVTSGKYASGD